MVKSWWQSQEKAGFFLLNLTVWLVLLLPKFLLRICIFVVTFVYFIVSKEERKNLKKFYENLAVYTSVQQDSYLKKYWKIYRNFYEFGVAICDKIAVWKHKITYQDLKIKNIEIMDLELRSGRRGSVLLVSHYGNTEIARALSNVIKELKIVILVYKKNSSQFLELISKISKNVLPMICIDDLDFNAIVELEKIIESGGHIGIMGDRVALSNTKNVKVDFLGKPCYFPVGAYFIAGILQARINILWCERIQGQYHVELEKVLTGNKEDNVLLGKDKIASIMPLVEYYVKSLEKHIVVNPHLWFNFYDYWGQNAKTKISI
ncbi:hypothetical protein [Helicobacter pullorum]|uniref:LpxL/LpxP family acyltransferase n=1 Tax=Helicobacter pullorum TaxID=35818 RepID=UPI00174A1D11|nr:hypothetical protein [Helicobacter pullorum]